MVLNQSYKSGRAEKGDILIEIEPKKNGGLVIELTSSVKALFGQQIIQLVKKSLSTIQLKHAKIKLTDFGALDHIILARLESLILQFMNCKPFLAQNKNTIHPTLKKRLRRTRLYLPGNQPDLALNAGLFGADCIILDLEDSVAPPFKADARILVRNTLCSIDFLQSERIVRINPFLSVFGPLDLQTILPALPDVILIPKCETAEDVSAVDNEIQTFRKHAKIDHPIYLAPLIESTRGVLHAEEIAFASPNNIALCFGAEDFTADLGASRTQDGKETFTARSLIVMAARTARLQALDTVYSDLDNFPGLIKSTRESISLGFDGRGVIHPEQIKPIHDCFIPTSDQIEQARLVIQAFQQAQASGSGVVSLGSKMIDAPVVARAEHVLELAVAMGIPTRITNDEVNDADNH